MKISNKKQILITTGVVLLGLVGAVTIYLIDSLDYKESLKPQIKIDKRVQSTQSPEKQNVSESDIEATQNIINILFLGIDKDEEREEWLGVYHSDTLAIARIDLVSKKIKVLNIPRDTYTYVPVENKLDKINHAYAFGSVKGDGVQASIDAVNYFMGKKVNDYYFLMDMQPIPSIVDEIGGVTLDVEIDMKDHGANLSKGLQLLNGKQAFDYIHWRYSAGGDIDRIKRQQKFISALIKQQRDSEEILQTLELVVKNKKDTQTDLVMKQMIGLAKLMSDIPNGSITYYNIPGSSKMIEGISYWVPDESETKVVINEFFQ